MTVLHKKGKLALVDERMCAHLIVDAGKHNQLMSRVAAELHGDYAELYNLWNDWMEKVVRDELYLVLSTSPITVDRNAGKFNEWIEGLYKSSSAGLPSACPIAIVPNQNYPAGDKWGRNILVNIPRQWFASPITLDFMLTMIGLIPKMRLGETLDDFFTRIVNSDAIQAA